MNLSHEFERYSEPLEVKLSQASTGEISGHGAVFGNVDRTGDIIVSGAFVKSIKAQMPLMLFGHDPNRPVGVWDVAREDAKGLYLEGRLNLQTTEGRDALAHLKMGSVKGLSIGYRVPKGGSEYDRQGNRLLKQVELFEVSLVTIPANPLAQVNSVKSAGSIREFERFLADHGFPRAAAKALASGGWPALAKADDTEAEDLLCTIQKSINDLSKGTVK